MDAGWFGQISDFEPWEVILTPRGQLAMSGDIFGCHTREVLWYLLGTGKDADKCLITHRKPHPQPNIAQQRMSMGLRLRNLGESNKMFLHHFLHTKQFPLQDSVSMTIKWCLWK
jgi:hypothetical protein